MHGFRTIHEISGTHSPARAVGDAQCNSIRAPFTRSELIATKTSTYHQIPYTSRRFTL